MDLYHCLNSKPDDDFISLPPLAVRTLVRWTRSGLLVHGGLQPHHFQPLITFLRREERAEHDGQDNIGLLAAATLKRSRRASPSKATA
ncbi:hypothetical protein AVEN_47685-1 [Araneus ventricosus]|uniref:Uncharacterized protein n=1 Tax=Araneus ventricosus TaxID=182803 RepID=A0A4Y2MZ07_ARAVE|nr:hypothetical protein AVEN_47685-1 [Araneus ventricosus]